MAATDFPVYFACIRNDVPGDGQHSMGDCHGSLRSASTRRHTPEQRSQKAFFFVRDRPRTLRQNPTQISVAFPHAARKPLAGAFVVAGAQPSPTHQVSRIRKSAHVQPDLGNDHRGGGEIDPGNGAQAADQIPIWQQSFGELLVQWFQFPIQVRQVLHGSCNSQRKCSL